MAPLLKTYPVMVGAVVILDLLWLGVVMRGFYRGQLGHLLSETVVWAAAGVFYLIFAAGLLYFAVLPGLGANSLLKAAALGALLGAFAYATYDLTNHATLRDWPTIVTIVDIVWGAVLSSAVASLGWLVASFFLK